MATHRDLRAEVDAGRFRADLLYWVQVFTLELEPLRKRREEIPVLARALALRRGAAALPEDVLQALSRHDWPGNVRELANVVEAYLALGTTPRARPLAQGQAIDSALAAFVDPALTYAGQKADLLQRFTRAYLERLLQESGGKLRGYRGWSAAISASSLASWGCAEAEGQPPVRTSRHNRHDD